MPIYVMLMSVPLFLFALVLFLGGFGLQFLGHALDGSEPGEIKALRLWWAVAARRGSRRGPDPGRHARRRARSERRPVGKARRPGVPLSWTEAVASRTSAAAPRRRPLWARQRPVNP